MNMTSFECTFSTPDPDEERNGVSALAKEKVTGLRERGKIFSRLEISKRRV